MSPAARDKLDNAINDVIGFAAVLDIVQSDMVRNAVASQSLVSEVWSGYRVHLMTDMQARGFDFALSQMVDAVEDLRKAHEALG